MERVIVRVCICGMRLWQAEVLTRLGCLSSSIFEISTWVQQPLIWSHRATAVADKIGIFTWSVCGFTQLHVHTSHLLLWIKSSCYLDIHTCPMIGISEISSLPRKRSRQSIPRMTGMLLFRKHDAEIHFLCVKWRVRTLYQSKVWSRISSIAR